MSDNRQVYLQNKESLLCELKSSQSQISFDDEKKTNQYLKIDVKKFNHIIALDPKRFIIEAEGMASYGQIVQETLKFDCLPPIVPDCPTLTVREAIAKCAFSSSSFRFGFVYESVLEIDVLTGDDIFTLSARNEKKDLFLSLPNTAESLGVVLKAKLPLIPIKKYVKVSKLFFSDFDSFIKNVEEISLENKEVSSISFVEGVIFNEKEMVISIGEMVEKGTEPSSNQTDYLHCMQSQEECLFTLSNYLWRWNTCTREKKRKGGVSELWSKLLETFGLNKIKHLEGVFPLKEANKLNEFVKSSANAYPIYICPISPYSTQKATFYPIESTQIYLYFKFLNAFVLNKGNENWVSDLEKASISVNGNQRDNQVLAADPTYEHMKKIYDPHNRLKKL